jgi:hypothetical protein
VKDAERQRRRGGYRCSRTQPSRFLFIQHARKSLEDSYGSGSKETRTRMKIVDCQRNWSQQHVLVSPSEHLLRRAAMYGVVHWPRLARGEQDSNMEEVRYGMYISMRWTGGQQPHPQLTQPAKFIVIGPSSHWSATGRTVKQHQSARRQQGGFDRLVPCHGKDT